MTADARIGTVIAGYQIETLVGRGGMGVVYRAHDTALDRNVALKLISPERADDKRFRERFLRESRIAASIDHANIVPIYDAGEYEGQLFIAMRFVDGTDLDELLEAEGPLAPERALALLSQAGSALDTAHARGLVHRDVKPANILVTREMGRDEHVYLSDFGLSRDSGERDEAESDEAVALRASTSLGTIDYASPEQIGGRATDARSDVYALGCVLYQSLTGETPYKASSPVQVLFGHLTDSPPVASQERPDLDPAIDDVLTRALAKEPEERYERASALIEDAQRALTPRARLLERIGTGRVVGLALAAIAAIAALTVWLALTVGGGDRSNQIRSETDGLLRDPGTLSRIDPATNVVTGTLQIGPEPTALAVGDGGVFVTHLGDNSVWRIDEATLQTARGVTNGTPYGVAVNRGGTLFVADDGVTSGFKTTQDPADSIATSHPTAIATSGTDVWIAGRGGVAQLSGRGAGISPEAELGAEEFVEIDTRQGSETQHEYFSDLAVSGDSVWLTGDAHDTTRRDALADQSRDEGGRGLDRAALRSTQRRRD